MKGLVKTPEELLGQQPIPKFVLEEWERMILKKYNSSKDVSFFYEKDMEKALKKVSPLHYNRRWLFVDEYFEANGWKVIRNIGGDRVFFIFRRKEEKETPESKKRKNDEIDDDLDVEASAQYKVYYQ